MLLGFNGSPKPDSNLRRIIEMMLKESGKDYRIYDLAQMDIKPCMGCVKCAKNNRCVMKDDMFPLYDEIVKSDAIVVGAVVYFKKANGFTHRILMRTYLSESEPLKEGMLIRKWTPKTAESSLLCRLKYS